MIVVKIELHSAVTGVVSELGRMLISNDGTSRDPKRGHYDVRLMRRGSPTVVQRQARVEKYPRAAFSVWVLVARALKNVGIERFADFFEDQTDIALAERGL